MGIFTKYLTRELGKNTGKWVSNALFGDEWATPYKLSVNEKTRAERLKLQQKTAHDSELKLLTSQLGRFKTMVQEGYMTRQEFETAKRNILSKLSR